MISLFGIILCLICFTNQFSLINSQVLLINDRSDVLQFEKQYTIVDDNVRHKRNNLAADQTSMNTNESEKINGRRCDEDSYTKLYTCSHVNECTALASCLSSINCPLTKQSYGSLLVNLLYLLGSHHCNNDQENVSCSHENRFAILHNLLTHWTDLRLNFHHDPIDEDKIDQDSYCKTIPDFIIGVEEEVKERCELHSRQVEAFLQSYLCSNHLSSSSSSTPRTIFEPINQELPIKEPPIPMENLDYLDEDKDLNFIHGNTHLMNNSDQTVYMNDHQYYNVSYIVPKSGEIPMNFIPDYRNKFTRIHALANRHRSAFTINLKFDFPFYGHTVNRILVGTGGFIYTGDLLHSSLIGSTQYIAPFMANFDVSIGGNQSNIKYFDNSTHFVCTWNQLYLQDQQEAGPFTFQAILQNTGNIYFNYVRIPEVTVSTENHAHRIGLSDAFMSQHNSHEHSIRVITLYDKLNLDRNKIRSGVSVILTMDNTCNTFTDCSSCLANRGKRYNCSWCDDIQKCSDGYDRSRQQWVRAQCHRLASENICPHRIDDSIDLDHFNSLSSKLHIDSNDGSFSSPSHGILSTFRTIVSSLFFTVAILSVLTLVAAYAYAYRNPTSPVGMWLIEHRPSRYVARFRQFTHRNNVAT